jgi:hypothetical protein
LVAADGIEEAEQEFLEDLKQSLGLEGKLQAQEGKADRDKNERSAAIPSNFVEAAGNTTSVA